MAYHADYNNYIIFNPEGKVKQLEYIKNTTMLGNTVLGLCNKNCGIFITFNEKRSKLADYQQKIFSINKNTLFSFSGITNDGANIVDYLVDRSVNEQVIKERCIHPLQVFDDLCYDASIRTVTNGSRLYGVEGLLMTAYEGIRLVIFDPKGSVKEVRGMSIGNRSQSCRTVLETECLRFDSLSQEELIEIGVRALKNAYPEQDVLRPDNVDIWILEDQNDAYKVDSRNFIN